MTAEQTIEELRREIAAAQHREGRLRRLLAMSYAGAKLYCEDGCLFDGRRYPFINFKWDSPDAIESAMVERGKQSASPPPEPAPQDTADGA